MAMEPEKERAGGHELFFSYAHEDEALRDELEKQLIMLQRKGLISGWHDRAIMAGADWAKEIDVHLESASIILLLVSVDFLASEYCYGVEMKRALERQDKGEARVIPIILRDVDWSGAPFQHLQALPTDGNPVTSWSNLDEAFTNIAKQIRRTIEHLKAAQFSNSSSRSMTETAPTDQTLWHVPYRRNLLFTGRQDILDQLQAQLRGNRAIALTQPQAICGLGGVGKTQTALEYAYRYRDSYKVILWATADKQETLVSEFVTLAGVLGLREKDVQDQNVVVAAVKRWLENHADWLLILDNADDIEMVSRFLPVNAKGDILLTTQAQATEPLAHSIDIDRMDLDEGCLFLLRRAGLLSSTDPLEKAAQNIVRELGALPLALDQAGAFIRETKCSLLDYQIIYRKKHADLLRRRGKFAQNHPNSIAITLTFAFEKVEQSNRTAANLLCLCAFLAPDAIQEEILLQGEPSLSETSQTHAGKLFAFNEALGKLLEYSLIERSPNRMLSVHRLVQAVLVDGMVEELRRQWVECAVKAVNAVFPEVKFENWPRCKVYIPHALLCADRVEQYTLKSSEAANLLGEAGRYLGDHAQYKQAESLAKRSLEMSEQVLGINHPNTATALNILGFLYTEQGFYEQAEPLLLRALAIDERERDPNDPELARKTLTNLAYVYYKQKKYEDAEDLCQRALKIVEEVFGRDHAETSIALHNLATLYCSQGKYNDAEPLYLRSRDIDEKSLVPDHPDIAKTLHRLADLYSAQGKYEEAEPLYRRSLVIYEKSLNPDHPMIVEILESYANLLRATNRPEVACGFEQRAAAILARRGDMDEGV